MLRVATLVSILAVVACAEQGDEQMNVLNNTAVAGDSCTLTGAASQAFLAHGEIYARSPNGYFLTPLIQSRIISQPGIDPIQNTIQLRSANIELTLRSVSVHHANDTFTDTQPNVALAPTTALFSGALTPGGTVNVGFDVISPPQLRDVLARAGGVFTDDPTTTDSVRAEVVAAVTIFGDLNGSEVSSSPFIYPISVCTDCVVHVYRDPSTRQPVACPVPSSLAPRQGNVCNVFQDGAVDCCLDTGSNSVICPAPILAM